MTAAAGRVNHTSFRGVPAFLKVKRGLDAWALSCYRFFRTSLPLTVSTR